MSKSFISQLDLTSQEILELFDRSRAMKARPYEPVLTGKSLVMFFEKPSTRTRLSFEIGMSQLGGHAVYLDRDSSQLSRGESIADTARVVSRYADLMMARVFAHSTVRELAEYSSIPVINGLSDEEHPCQSMADLFTIWEARGHVDGLRIAFVGDGNNNVTHSLMLGAAQLGASIVVAAPPGLQPGPLYVHAAARQAELSGGAVEITDDPEAAVDRADVVYTDVWVSMGQEGGREKRLALLEPYQVNAALVRHAQPEYLFMHCLPAHIGEEVTADIAYGPRSVIFEEAENRLHIQKALMMYLLEKSGRT